MGRFSEIHRAREEVTFTVRGSSREEIAQGIKATMSQFGVAEYYVDSIEYKPTVTFVDGRSPEDWSANVTVLVVEAREPRYEK